jgi:hypothetical protein
MLDFSVLDKKTVIDDKVIFTSVSTIIGNRIDIPLVAFVVIDDTTVCRVDLIVKHYWGAQNINDIDAFLKFNKVTNPFSIPIGKVLVVPDHDSLVDNISYKSIKKYTNASTASSQSSSTGNKTFTFRSILEKRGNGFTVDSNGSMVF